MEEDQLVRDVFVDELNNRAEDFLEARALVKAPSYGRFHLSAALQCRRS